MDALFLLIPLGGIIGAVGAAATRGAGRREREREGEGVAPRDPEAVWRELMTLYTRLRKAGASLRYPWISGCIAAIEAGGDCPPDVAAEAVARTRGDLAGTRWMDSEMWAAFGRAEESLAGMI